MKPGIDQETLDLFVYVGFHVAECSEFLDKSELTPLKSAAEDNPAAAELVPVLTKLETLAAMFGDYSVQIDAILSKHDIRY